MKTKLIPLSTRRSRRSILLPPAIFVAAAMVLLFTACDGDSSSPTEPRNESLVLASAVVTVDGQPVDGQTLSPGVGSSTRFEARLYRPDGQPALDCQAWVDADRPAMQGAHHRGTLTLYDDGTHGDHVAGDGVYCYEDFAGAWGCHGPNAEPGEYRWDFHAQDRFGYRSNHRWVITTVGGQ